MTRKVLTLFLLLALSVQKDDDFEVTDHTDHTDRAPQNPPKEEPQFSSMSQEELKKQEQMLRDVTVLCLFTCNQKVLLDKSGIMSRMIEKFPLAQERERAEVWLYSQIEVCLSRLDTQMIQAIQDSMNHPEDIQKDDRTDPLVDFQKQYSSLALTDQ